MKRRILSLLLCCCVGASTWCAGVQAQPDPDAGKAQNPVAGADKKANMDKALAAGREAAEKLMAMTPAQQREWMLQLQEQQVRLLMTQHGFNDMELQEIVSTYLKKQHEARAPIRLRAALLRDAIADKKSSDEAITALLQEHAKAIDVERERNKQEAHDLATELNLEKKPRLHALLQMWGVIGDSGFLSGAPFMGASTALAFLPSPDEAKQMAADEADKKEQ